MTNKVSWTPVAKTKKDTLIKQNPVLRSWFAATEQSLKNGEFKLPALGTVEISVYGTGYKLVLEIETDRVAKVKYIDIDDVK